MEEGVLSLPAKCRRLKVDSQFKLTGFTQNQKNRSIFGTSVRLQTAPTGKVRKS